jgi:hypothetical protein
MPSPAPGLNLSFGEHLRRPMDDPDRLAAPLDRHDCARRHSGDTGGERKLSAFGIGRFIGEPSGDGCHFRSVFFRRRIQPKVTESPLPI